MCMVENRLQLGHIPELLVMPIAKRLAQRVRPDTVQDIDHRCRLVQLAVRLDAADGLIALPARKQPIRAVQRLNVGAQLPVDVVEVQHPPLLCLAFAHGQLFLVAADRLFFQLQQVAYPQPRVDAQQEQDVVPFAAPLSEAPLHVLDLLQRPDRLHILDFIFLSRLPHLFTHVSNPFEINISNVTYFRLSPVCAVFPEKATKSMI